VFADCELSFLMDKHLFCAEGLRMDIAGIRIGTSELKGVSDGFERRFQL
jgi:hypothetical protein